jgi:D-alanine--poly(phosphoribitol) ligase subunit 1
MYKYNLGISFEEIVEKYSDNVALKFNATDSVSYEILNNKSNQLARYLLGKGVRQNDVVCISGDKKVSTFASMIACLKIGAVYTILDPDSPVERLRKIIMTCLPKILVIEQEVEQKIRVIKKELTATIINNETDEFEKNIKLFEHTNLKESRNVTGTNPAYIMFTSGSTGFPKGAVMTHNNVLNLIDWSIETFNFSSDDILTNVNPLYFDNSVFDFYTSLFSGACLVPFSKDTVTNPQLLVSLIDELRCTSWFSVPSLLMYLQTMKVLDKSNMKFIKRFIFGGEGYPKSKLKKLYDMYSDRVEFYNVYGPTECTCMCSSYKITAEDCVDLQGFPPLGKIADNFSYLILDGDNEKVQNGEVGELCLLGPNVGKGYCNDPERTQVSFVQNPYNEHYAEKMYKTGDLVKYNSEDGKIYIMGRSDNQIKHMGYRIELEEIETALSCLTYVSQAAVLPGNSRGLSQIVAVISSEDGFGEKTIREDLKQIIPDYMIPTIVYFEKELPKNSNGKVDRIKLAEKYLRYKG